MSAIDKAIAEWECARLISEFVQLNDAGEYDRLAALFTADGVFTRPSAPKDLIKGRDTILAHFKSRPARFSRHLVMNLVVNADPQNPDRATAKSYLVLYVSSTPAEEGKPRKADASHFIGTYTDTFVRENGRWLFKERIGSLDMTT
jgi:hypothetical protein